MKLPDDDIQRSFGPWTTGARRVIAAWRCGAGTASMKRKLDARRQCLRQVHAPPAGALFIGDPDEVLCPRRIRRQRFAGEPQRAGVTGFFKAGPGVFQRGAHALQIIRQRHEPDRLGIHHAAGRPGRPDAVRQADRGSSAGVSSQRPARLLAHGIIERDDQRTAAWPRRRAPERPGERRRRSARWRDSAAAA